MAKYQAYPEYKDSGVEWLGDIPKHWQVIATKYIAQLNPKKTGLPRSKLSKMCSFIPMEKLKLNALILDEERIINQVYDGYTYFEDGDILIAKVTPCFENKNMAVAEGLINEIGFGSSEIYVLRCSNHINRRFLFYRLQEDSFMAIAIAAMSGAGGLKRVPAEVVNSFLIALPELLEQSEIATFLDHETAKIDNLIEKQKQLIELLKERRQAVISHAVTKGLNPDVPMKDSGVEWLGEVPEHWDVMPLKYTCSLIKDGTHLPPARVDKGIPLLSVRNIINGKFDFRDDDSQISYKDYKSLCSSFVPKKDDVLLAIVGATLGKVALVPKMDSFHIQRSLGVFRTNSLICPQLLSYVFNSKGFQSLLWENAGFSAQPGIYLGSLANFSVPVPPINEQTEIIEFIVKTANKLDLLISQATKLTVLMQERRTALISAAVTGKIDVRNWVAPEGEKAEVSQEATA
ncbi:restriction endonuclease subunit S [Serratia quinivorans]|uniref:restriction endonuclease subunit S n=1 Tax=Serratia quinivorans TaxID=137545 RepID=UPI0021799F18|nr:restriction endonuclease subunit S [Serratia quinivorans]CAI0978836.1 Type I restriction enzyme EcoKI specificity protein [Serratia quinivorans]CAI1064898.1 Type I restriction enzyme EcoKI specificity protein [Serratia quinivorans]CAI1782787.1 Type I restriction enzyme EcoKI specificity protein [Serratia quinivorans]CAI2126212.1 Type I restriction enzyme EcoKI specificity protein [Serratia quinivorans]CAI2127243.1 Type I restriction enzyme EcoKI specificity protein [Serratia quinivorans]